jgi:hypothetical protein
MKKGTAKNKVLLKELTQMDQSLPLPKYQIYIMTEELKHHNDSEVGYACAQQT